MKSFQEFCACVTEEVKRQLGDGYETTLRTVRKNNNIELKGLTIRCGDTNVMPAIYLDPFYEQYSEGRTMEHVVEDVIDVYRENRVPWETEPDMSPAKIRASIQFRMVNRRMNEEEMATMPHLDFGDFSVGFQWVITTDDRRMGIVRITNEQSEEFGLDVEEMTELAIANTERVSPPRICRIEEVISEMLSECSSEDFAKHGKRPEEFGMPETMFGAEDDFPMYVLTNEQRNMGASALLMIPQMDRFRERLGEDFWILPSSIHEVILIPASRTAERDKMRQMVQEINATQVPPQEVLADDVYLYSEFRAMVPESIRNRMQARAAG